MGTSLKNHQPTYPPELTIDYPPLSKNWLNVKTELVLLIALEDRATIDENTVEAAPPNNVEKSVFPYNKSLPFSNILGNKLTTC